MGLRETSRHIIMRSLRVFNMFTTTKVPKSHWTQNSSFLNWPDGDLEELLSCSAEELDWENIIMGSSKH